MAKLPKLKVINTFQNVPEEIYDFEHGKYLPFSQHLLIMVEDQVVWSYEELVQLAAGERFRDRDFLEVRILDVITGG